MLLQKLYYWDIVWGNAFYMWSYWYVISGLCYDKRDLLVFISISMSVALTLRHQKRRTMCVGSGGDGEGRHSWECFQNYIVLLCWCLWVQGIDMLIDMNINGSFFGTLNSGALSTLFVAAEELWEMFITKTWIRATDWVMVDGNDDETACKWIMWLRLQLIPQNALTTWS